MARKRIKPGIIVSVIGMKVLKTYKNTAPKTAYTIIFGTKVKLTGEGLLKAQSSKMEIIWE